MPRNLDYPMPTHGRFGAPDDVSRPPAWKIALAGTTLIAALLGANAIVAALAQASAVSPQTTRRSRRPVHFAL
jgi:hypothetical protein